MPNPIRLAVLLSGSGRTLQNLIDRIESQRLAARIEIVISSKPGVHGLERAQHAGLPTACIPRTDHIDADHFSDAIERCLQRYEIDLTVLAGFLSLLRVPPRREGHILNIHPALLPAFCGRGCYGMRVHRRVVESGVRYSGCTVHFVDSTYDQGPIVLQRIVPVHFADTPETLANRVFLQECEAYPEAIQLFAEDRLRIQGHRVEILPPAD